VLQQVVLYQRQGPSSRLAPVHVMLIFLGTGGLVGSFVA